MAATDPAVPLPFVAPDRDAILAVYAQGPDAVVTLVLTLVDHLRVALERVQALEARVTEQDARIAELEAARARDSHNSSQPPSTDRVRPAPRSLRERSGKRPGGQPGHPGTTLAWRAMPDAVVRHAPATCHECGAALAAPAADAWRDALLVGGAEPIIERRQMTDLPPVRAQVTEHQCIARQCVRCGAWSQGVFPPEVTTTLQYGPRLRALGVYLLTQQLLPAKRASEMLEHLAGTPISPATLLRAAHQAAAVLAPVEAQIAAGLRVAPVVHYDETGCFVATQGQWVHTAATTTLTHYTVHPKRGREAHHAIDILPQSEGTAVHDGYSSYFDPAYACTHALCVAHLLRELTFVAEEHDQPWAGQLKRSLRAMLRGVARAKADGRTELPTRTLRRYWARYEALVAEGERAQPPPVRSGARGRLRRTAAGNLLVRLRRDVAAVLRFVTDFAVPGTNNTAERALRMTKVHEKISGGFRTARGAAVFATLRGYLDTARKQGQAALDVLYAVFLGQPFIPVVPE